MTDARRSIPSLEKLLSSSPIAEIVDRESRERVADMLRAILADVRTNPDHISDDPKWYACEVSTRLARSNRQSLRPVINASGVVLHTNLGRAPLSDAAMDAMRAVSHGYSNLEYDIEDGERGSRYTHCSELLCQLTGAEVALVVNNNAAALVLALNTLALGKRVVVSRGELVEIGDSFRIAEIIERSGAMLAEIGATNRTHPADYETAAAGAAAILKVHRSNYRITGFVSDVDAPTIAFISRQSGLPFVHDLGSGLLEGLEDLGLPRDVTAKEAIASGADVVTMSGDKLLGGPQAGLIVGKAELIQRMKRNPLCRALRVDKLTLSALEATLQSYLRGRARQELPVLRMIALTREDIRPRAEGMKAKLVEAGIDAETAEDVSTIGGGAYPGAELPTVVVRIVAREERLRLGDPAVISRENDGRVVIDLRTVAPSDDAVLLERIVDAAR